MRASLIRVRLVMPVKELNAKSRAKMGGTKRKRRNRNRNRDIPMQEN